MYTCPPTSDARHGRTYALGPVDGATPTLAVLRLESRTYEYYVDARVTDINLEVLASLREMDFRQINERIQKQTEEKWLDGSTFLTADDETENCKLR